MKRTVRLALLCVFFGVITTFVVAWGCMLARMLPDSAYEHTFVFRGETAREWWIGSAESGLGWRGCALYPDLPGVAGGRIKPEPLPEWIVLDMQH